MGKGKVKAYMAETEDEANSLCRKLDKYGFRWRNGERYSENNEWKHYKENTVYIPSHGMFVNQQWAKDNNVPLLHCSEFKPTFFDYIKNKLNT